MASVKAVLNLIYVIFLSIFDYFIEFWKKFGPASLVYKNVSGKYVLITGAGSGIGQHLSLLFAQKGCHLILWDVNAKGLEDTKKLCSRPNQKIITSIVDVTNRQQVYKEAEEIQSVIPNGHVDILINNAGIVSGKPFLQTEDESIIRTMNVNTLAHFWTLKAFLPSMVKNNSGHIVSIASSAGLTGNAGLVDYCASKFAAVGIEESLRHELWNNGVNGVHSTVVCPYFISTGMFHGITLEFTGLLPESTVADAAFYTMDATLREINFLVFPQFLKFLMCLRPFFTSRSVWMLMNALGVTNAMNTFKGREKKKD